MGSFKNSLVIELKPSDFKGKTISHPALKSDGMVMFYAEWCGHCVKTAPEFIKVANVYGNSGYPLFSFDCEKYGEFAGKLGIKGYPTIKHITKKQLGTDYTGPRDPLNIMGDICKSSRICKTK